MEMFPFTASRAFSNWSSKARCQTTKIGEKWAASHFAFSDATTCCATKES